MYLIRKPGYDGLDLAMQWALPDRVFFASGACHILAWAFLDRYPDAGGQAVWIRPNSPFRGNHIVVRGEGWLFDYHGFSRPDVYLARHFRRARRLGARLLRAEDRPHATAEWEATLVELPPQALVSEPLSRTYDGLWLRQPDQYLHNALPRARAFLGRYGGAATPYPGAERVRGNVFCS